MNWELWYRLISFLGRRIGAYRQTFEPDHARPVLVDLAKFCRANASTWDDDPSKRDVLIGRREVWLRIQEHLRLTPEQMAEIYSLAEKPKENA